MESKLLHKGEYTTLELISLESRCFVRKSSPFPANLKLFKEAMFIQNIIPDTAKIFFPQIISQKDSFEQNEVYYYDMAYYAGRLLREMCFDESISVEQVLKNIYNVLSKVYQNLYKIKSDTDPKRFVKDYYFDRILDRLNPLKNEKKEFDMFCGNIRQLSKKQTWLILSNIVSLETIFVNDRKILGPLKLINMFQNNNLFYKQIIPNISSMSLIHGDLHFGNIMITSNLPIFLDPNGFQYGGDIAYDLGKILLSIEILDPIYEKLIITPDIKLTENRIHITDLRRYRNKKIENRQSYILKMVTEEILPNIFYELIRTDKNLISRAKMVNGLHALACSHTFIQNRKDIALHLFLFYLIKINDELTSITDFEYLYE